MFWDDIQTPLKGSSIQRGFSSKIPFIPKYSFPTWLVYKTSSFDLPKFKEHKFTSHPTCNTLYVNKLTMLFAGVLNSWSNSLKPGGHDTNQDKKKMTKDAYYEGSSQHSTEDLTKGRNGKRPEHLKFFLLVFLNSQTSCK